MNRNDIALFSIRNRRIRACDKGILQNHRPSTGYRPPTHLQVPQRPPTTDHRQILHRINDHRHLNHRQVFHQSTDYRLTDQPTTGSPTQLTTNPNILTNRVTTGPILSLINFSLIRHSEWVLFTTKFVKLFIK